MNDVLFLKGEMNRRSNTSKNFGQNLPKGTVITAAHISALADQLGDILKFWQRDTLIDGALVSVHYTSIVAKSNRLCRLLGYGGKSPSLSVRGAKFDIKKNEKTGHYVRKHVFTHYVSLDTLKYSIRELTITGRIIMQHFHGSITQEAVEELCSLPSFPYEAEIKKTYFKQVLFDAFHVDCFNIDHTDSDMSKESIISLYRTSIPLKEILKEVGIGYVFDRVLDDTTVRLTPEEIRLLQERAPYLISMSVADLSDYTDKNILDSQAEDGSADELDNFPSPRDEPIVGVIDTQFNEEVPFRNWVEYHNMLSPDIPITYKDRLHGTRVDSIIVDGPRLNPSLEDGCGRFRVRHFGVATAGRFSSFDIIRQIREIVATNRDIKVWNFSLGSSLEIKESSISPEAAELDRLQNEYDVLFVIAGTNLSDRNKQFKQKIGAPADSLNSIVVNSLNRNGEAASYTRIGPVLSFFNKPDVSCFGGDGNSAEDRIAVSDGSPLTIYVSGTSYAAPWITRKAAYMIYKMGLSRELTKALIIDSAAGWTTERDYEKTGYGAVPVHINDILKTPDDEIRFLLTGAAESYETYTYNIPIPIVNDRHPFFARATMVYFPKCSRNQGVDYTNTELDIHFGRVAIKKDGTTELKSINKNMQSEAGLHTLYENEAREEYRKWDNVKHLSDTISTRSKPKQVYDAGLWGMRIYAKERLTNKHKDPLPFGIVVTLKEMKGKNRIDEFKKLCMARGWLVNDLNIRNQVEVYETAEEEINWD